MSIFGESYSRISDQIVPHDLTGNYTELVSQCVQSNTWINLLVVSLSVD